jgi:hypothetical protein
MSPGGTQIVEDIMEIEDRLVRSGCDERSDEHECAGEYGNRNEVAG